MSIIQSSILIALGIGGLILAYAFIRFLRQEGQATRLLDLQVRAAENSADFALAPDSFASMIQNYHLSGTSMHSKVTISETNFLRFILMAVAIRF